MGVGKGEKEWVRVGRSGLLYARMDKSGQELNEVGKLNEGDPVLFSGK